MSRIPKIKTFYRVYWKSDAGPYMGFAYHGGDSLILYIGPIMAWIHK